METIVYVCIIVGAVVYCFKNLLAVLSKYNKATLILKYVSKNGYGPVVQLNTEDYIPNLSENKKRTKRERTKKNAKK